MSERRFVGFAVAAPSPGGGVLEGSSRDLVERASMVLQSAITRLRAEQPVGETPLRVEIMSGLDYGSLAAAAALSSLLDAPVIETSHHLTSLRPGPADRTGVQRYCFVRSRLEGRIAVFVTSATAVNELCSAIGDGTSCTRTQVGHSVALEYASGVHEISRCRPLETLG